MSCITWLPINTMMPVLQKVHLIVHWILMTIKIQLWNATPWNLLDVRILGTISAWATGVPRAPPPPSPGQSQSGIKMTVWISSFRIGMFPSNNLDRKHLICIKQDGRHKNYDFTFFVISPLLDGISGVFWAKAIFYNFQNGCHFRCAHRFHKLDLNLWFLDIKTNQIIINQMFEWYNNYSYTRKKIKIWIKKSIRYSMRLKQHGRPRNTKSYILHYLNF